VSQNPVRYTAESLGALIFRIRGQRVMLDADLASIYGVQTRRLNEQDIRSQLANDSGHGGRRKLPYVLTEHGANMAANVLNSPEAIQVSVFVVRAFIKMREALISRSDPERRLLQIENILLAHDESIRDLYEQIRPLLLPPPDRPRKKIGFEVKESAGRYGKESKRK
jgi:hypothetical protein